MLIYLWLQSLNGGDGLLTELGGLAKILAMLHLLLHDFSDFNNAIEAIEIYVALCAPSRSLTECVDDF